MSHALDTLQRIASKLRNNGQSDDARSIERAVADVNGWQFVEHQLSRTTGDLLSVGLEFDIDAGNYEVSLKPGHELQNYGVDGPLAVTAEFSVCPVDGLEVTIEAKLVSVANDVAVYRLTIVNDAWDRNFDEQHFDERLHMPAGSFSVAR